MNLSNFLARRIAFSKSKSFTKIIVRIAIAAIALSLTTMILTSLIINGFKSEISHKVFGFWGHIHINDVNINRSFEPIPIKKDADYIDSIRTVGQLEFQVPYTILGKEIDGKVTQKSTKGGVRHVQPYIWTAGILSTKKEFGAIQLKGIDHDFDWDYLPDFIADGERLELSGDISDGIVVSTVTADKLELKIGQRIRLSTLSGDEQIKKVFKVTGFYNTGLEEYDKKFAFVDIRKTQEMLGWNENEVSGFEVFLDDIEDLDRINEYLYIDVVPPRVYTETIRTKFPSIFEWLKLQDINEDLLLWLMVIVAVINMITALLILILERSHMIGVLKSLGATNWQVRKVFLYNAAYIIFFGLLIGNIIGLGVGYIQQQTQFITLDESSYYLAYAPILYKWDELLLINLFCFLITIVFLILPTYLVTSITPIKTLRFE